MFTRGRGFIVRAALWRRAAGGQARRSRNARGLWRAKAVIAALAALAALVVAGVGGAHRIVHADDNVTDLPFFGTFGTSCFQNGTIWHHGCFDNDPNWAGVDFVMDEGTTIYAPGDGLVNRIKRDRAPNGGYGDYIEMLNGPGSIRDTVMAHLSSQFKGMIDLRMCLFTPLGYSGATGNATGPHLHFESDAFIGFRPRVPETDPPRVKFTPIFGLRSQGTQVTQGELESRSPVSHDCGPNGCDEHTNARVVDDTQTAEFTVTGATDWTTAIGKGFSYFTSTKGAFLSTRYADDPVKTARWEPDLKHINANWAVFAFIPNLDGHPTAAAGRVSYVVKTWSRNPAAPDGFELHAEEAVISQNEHPGEWVHLGGHTFATEEDFPSPLITVELSSRHVNIPGTLCPLPNTCPDRRILADAMLFSPDVCH